MLTFVVFPYNPSNVHLYQFRLHSNKTKCRKKVSLQEYIHKRSHSHRVSDELYSLDINMLILIVSTQLQDDLNFIAFFFTLRIRQAK